MKITRRPHNVTIATEYLFPHILFCQLLCFPVNCFTYVSLTMAPQIPKRQPKYGGRASASQPVLPSENPGLMQTLKEQLDPALIPRVIYDLKIGIQCWGRAGQSSAAMSARSSCHEAVKNQEFTLHGRRSC
jgi:hypothetical protein